MIKLDEILADKKKSSKEWESILITMDKDNYFLLMLIPLMEYIFCFFKQSIDQKYIKLQRCITKEFLINLIVINFILDVKPMIIRVCVLRMYLARKENLLNGSTPEQRFDDFITWLCQPENSIELLNNFPLLKEQIEIFAGQYIKVIDELFCRLNQDFDELVSHHFIDDLSYHLETLELSGDRHRQGHAVIVLGFSNSTNSLRIVYKPRSLAIDVAFQKFIAWFNQRTQNLNLFVFKIIDKKNYGWCEFIEYKLCQNSDELRQFYYRMGIWLMLTYLFRGSDIHAENIIAHGMHPVIVDYECLLAPYFLLTESNDKTLSRFLVSDTAFLPEKIMLNKEYKGFDISALGAEGGEASFYTIIGWLDVGKDTMHAERVYGVIPALLNKPKNDINLLDFEEDFLRGFEETYHLILHHLPELSGKDSPLHQFKSVQVRVVMRDTIDYAKLLYESWHPKFLLSRKARTEHFSWVTRIIDQLPLYEKFITAELCDLNQNNIPIFICQSTEKKILDSAGNCVDIVIEKSGYEAMLENLQTYLHENDLLVQKTLISNNFEAAKLNKSTKTANIPAHVDQEFPAFSQVQAMAIDIAKRELDRLLELYIVNRGRIFWPMVVKNVAVWAPTFTDIHLYDGIAGIALSFAYGAFILKEDRYLATAELCLNSLRLTLSENGTQFLDAVGGFTGVGSLLYTFSALYRLWRNESIKNDLNQLLEVILPLLEKDQNLDIMSGAAGCLVVLLSMKDILPHHQLLPYAKACVEHILHRYPDPCILPGDSGAISTLHPLLGFSHGVAGIAWALHQYFILDPRTDLKKWIQAALMYEQSKFNEAAGDKNTWCHGAVGIGLARLDMARNDMNSDYAKDFEFEQDIKNALRATIKQDYSIYQCLCHGNLGNLELLLNASQFIQDPELIKDYRQFASAIIYFLQKDILRCDTQQNFAAPGLMTGCAGVVYQMLRIAHPEQIPSILLLKSRDSTS